MTELSEYLEQAATGDAPHVDWSHQPWAAARAALAWLGLASAITPQSSGALLSTADAKLVCDYMMRRFVDESGRLAWSSHMLETAAEAAASSAGCPPESLVKSAWDFLALRELDALVYEFCRAFGGVLLSRRDRGWDLGWMRSSASPSQACLRYWTLAIKPELWEGEVELATMKTLSRYPFRF